MPRSLVHERRRPFASESFALGALRVLEPIGRGGMGEVWRGAVIVEPRRRIPVAVKFVTSERSRSPRALAAFRHEVQAAARLDHAGIVKALDHGVLDRDGSIASGGRFPPGAPY